MLGKKLRFVDLDDSPQQSNGSDCGIYVCSVLKYLLEDKLLATRGDQKTGMSLAGKAINAQNVRKHILGVIEDLRREGMRRGS